MKLENGHTLRIHLAGVRNATLIHVDSGNGSLCDTYAVADGDDIGAQINAILAMRKL
jgi:hypothetical protein